VSDATESILVCEGFHDRAFLQGWLTTRGWVPWKNKKYEPLGKLVKSEGIFAFHLPDSGWVRVVPSKGKPNISRVATDEVDSARTRRIQRVVIVWDDDRAASEDSTQSVVQAFSDWAEGVGAVRVDGTNEYKLPDGILATRLCSMVLGAADDHADTLPPKQTLERLVCAALRDADPKRAEHVAQWIAARPSPPASEKLHKTHAASHMAGWYSDHGYEDFFRTIWNDAKVRGALERRLDAIGATRILASLVAPSPA